MSDTRLIVAAASVLALAFTFNCSKDDAAETAPPGASSTTAGTGGMGGGGGAGGGTGGSGTGGGEPCMDGTDCSSNNCVGGACQPCELCTCLANDGPEVEMIAVDANIPMPAGGVIRDGWYHLTKVTAYTGPGGNTGATGSKFKQAVYFLGPEVELVVDRLDGDPELLISMGYQPDDNAAIDFTVICPADMPPYIPYVSYEFIDGDPGKLLLNTSGINADVSFEFDLIKPAGADDGTAGT